MKKGVIILIILVFVVILVSSTKEKAYYSHPPNPIIQEIKYKLGALSPEYAKIPIKVGNKSFTEDKAAITLCITNPKTGEYYDMNTLMYVTLHELSHVVTKASGEHSHADEFKENFSNLLKEASAKGIYNPSQRIPESYCGTTN